MLLTVLAIGGIFLAATVVAGLLMTYQIRQAAETNASTAAIMAADAGAEWALYKNTHPNETSLSFPTFTNGASLTVQCFTSSSVAIPQRPDGSGYVSRGPSGNRENFGCNSASTFSALSNGTHRNANRIFEIYDIQSFVGIP